MRNFNLISRLIILCEMKNKKPNIGEFFGTIKNTTYLIEFVYPMHYCLGQDIFIVIFFL